MTDPRSPEASPVHCSFTPEAPSARFTFSLEADVQAIELTLHARIESQTLDAAARDSLFRVYTAHPDVTGIQRDLMRPLFHDRIEKQAGWFSCTLVDPTGAIRGRWWLREEQSHTLGESRADDGFFAGPLPPGDWSIELKAAPFATTALELRYEITEHATEPNAPISIPRYQFPDEQYDEEEPAASPQWLVGELFDCGESLLDSRTAEACMERVDALQYQFACIADTFRAPMPQLAMNPNAIPIRGAVYIHEHARFLLLGIREQPTALQRPEPVPIDMLARETHEQGGLLTLLEPYGLDSLQQHYEPLQRTVPWESLDLLQVWSGVWEERFPEILHTLDWWDALLNRGQRVYGICGKGPDWPLDETQVERLPKTLALSDSLSESGILGALIQGHSYMTVEPAVRIWLEAEGSTMQMGGELRVPLNCPYDIHIHVTQMDRSGYIIVKTNTGVYCHMPLSSNRDTDLRFIAHAAQHVTWYRIEVYQYGRPLDRLMALSNPVFVRGLISL